MSPPPYDHAAVEILGLARTSTAPNHGNWQIDLETNPIVALDVVELFSFPRGMKIDTTAPVCEIEWFYHGVAVPSDGAQPADMAGVQQIDNQVLILDLFFRLTHEGLLTKMAMNDMVPLATFTIKLNIRAPYLKRYYTQFPKSEIFVGDEMILNFTFLPFDIISLLAIPLFSEIRLHIEKDLDLFPRHQSAAFHGLTPPHDVEILAVHRR